MRAKMAKYIGCKSTEVAFTNNTTEGMVFGTFGVDMEPGDEIVTTNHDHSSGVQPINLRAVRQGTKTVMIDLSSPAITTRPTVPTRCSRPSRPPSRRARRCSASATSTTATGSSFP